MTDTQSCLTIRSSLLMHCKQLKRKNKFLAKCWSCPFKDLDLFRYISKYFNKKESFRCLVWLYHYRDTSKVWIRGTKLLLTHVYVVNVLQYQGSWIWIPLFHLRTFALLLSLCVFLTRFLKIIKVNYDYIKFGNQYIMLNEWLSLKISLFIVFKT